MATKLSLDNSIYLGNYHTKFENHLLYCCFLKETIVEVNKFPNHNTNLWKIYTYYSLTNNAGIVALFVSLGILFC